MTTDSNVSFPATLCRAHHSDGRPARGNPGTRKARLCLVLFACLACLAACGPAPVRQPIALSPGAAAAAVVPARPEPGRPVVEPRASDPGSQPLGLQPLGPQPLGPASEISPATATPQIPGSPPAASDTPTATPAATAPLPTPAGPATAAPAPVPTFESDALRPDRRLRPPAATPAPVDAPTPDGEARTLRVPILMYHYISTPPDGADAVRRDNSVSPAVFESHLQYLRDQGYHVVTLDDLLYALVQGRPLPAKPVVLTFDDGYEDAYTNAFPLLRKYGMTGHFFLITDFVNQARAGYMTWPQVEEMARAGQLFGAHSRDHPDLSGKPVDYLVWEALGPMEAIQQHLGYHPRWIAYPSGAYDAQTIAVFKSANYWGGLTTRQGATHTGSDLFELTRVRVRGSYSAEDLGRLLNLDW